VASGGGKLQGETIVGCSVELWDLISGKEVRRFDGHESYVSCLAFSRDGRLLVSGGTDKHICLWDVKSRREINKWKAHDVCVNSIAFSPDGKRILSGGQDQNSDNSICLWNTATGTEIRRFAGHKSAVMNVSIAPDGQHAASASLDGTVRCWNVDSGKQCFVIPSRGHAATTVAFSPDGKSILVGYLASSEKRNSVLTDNPVVLFDATTGKETRRFVGHRTSVLCMAFSPDGKWAVSAGGGRRAEEGRQRPVDCEIRLWDVRTGRLVKSFAGHEGPIYSVSFSPEGKQFASGSVDQTVRVWRLTE
jgi:WD40 repeat protein